jgi:purine-binding chemotaxis protein CheW
MAQATIERAASDEALGTLRELLVFTLGEEQYAIDILKVQEIRGYESVTRIAAAPAFIKGVVNLRGSIVPIVDMRLKFALGEASYTPFTVVIILNVLERTVGIVVDGVSDVIQLAPDAIREAPEFGAAVDTAYIEGLSQVGDSMVIVMDIERLMSSAEMSLMEIERHAQNGQQQGGAVNG